MHAPLFLKLFNSEMDWREIILILTLIHTVTCVDRFCRFDQSDQCNATVGDKLSLQMVKDDRGVQLDLYKGLSDSRIRVFKFIISKANPTTFHESLRDRCEFIRHNWTLIINSVITADSGDYRLEIYNSSGTQISVQHLQVHFKDPQTLPIALICSAVILIILIIAAYYIYSKKKKQLETSSNGEISSNKKKNEEEIHYGEVDFSRARRPQKSQAPEECVYAQVTAQ